MRVSARSAALSLILVPLLALVACSSDDAEPDAEPAPTTTPTPTPTPTPTGPSAAAWADNVCTSLTDLTTDISAIAEGLSVELGSGDALDQLKTQLTDNVATAGTSLDDLLAAISDAPGTEGAQDLKTSLQSSADDVSAATQAARDAAQEAAAAQNVAGFIGAAGNALTATSEAMTAAKEYATTLTTAASNAGGTLRSAFADAESCTALEAAS